MNEETMNEKIDNQKKNKNNYAFFLIYILLGVTLFFQGFTHPFTDYNIQVLDDYYVAHGMTPFVDFFEHHPITHNYFLSPVFMLAGSKPVTGLYLLKFFALIGTALCALLVYRIAQKNNFPHPHVASIVFLTSYAALPINFIRYEFWVMFFILIFFWLRQPFLRGVILVFAALLSPITLPGTGVLSLAYLYHTWQKKKYNDKKELLPVLAGMLVATVAWRLLHYKIPLSLMYESIFVFNNLAGDLYIRSFFNILFFSLFFTIPLLLLGAIGAVHFLQKVKQKTTKEEDDLKQTSEKVQSEIYLALFFVSTVVLQIVAMNIAYGAFTRIKVPAPIPLLGIMTVFFAIYSPKKIFWFIGFQFALVLFVFTPSQHLPQHTFIETASQLNKCVAEDAHLYFPINKINEGSDSLVVTLFRTPGEYYWFFQDVINITGAPYEPPILQEPLLLCGNIIEQEKIICTQQEITQLTQDCSQLTPPRSLWTEFREKLKSQYS